MSLLNTFRARAGVAIDPIFTHLAPMAQGLGLQLKHQAQPLSSLLDKARAARMQKPVDASADGSPDNRHRTRGG